MLANDGSGSKRRAVPYPSPGPDLSPWELQAEYVKEGSWQLLIPQHAGGRMKKRGTSTPWHWLKLAAPDDHTNRKDRYWGSRGERMVAAGEPNTQGWSSSRAPKQTLSTLWMSLWEPELGWDAAPCRVPRDRTHPEQLLRTTPTLHFSWHK